MKSIFSFLTFFLFTTAGFAQVNTFYLKNDGTYIGVLKDDGTTQGDTSHADFTRRIEPHPDGNMFLVTEVYNNGKTRRVGRSTTPQVPSFEGEVMSYYTTGVRKSANHYARNQKTGEQTDYFFTGKPFRTVVYPDTFDPTNEFNNNYLIKSMTDTAGVAQVVGGNGIYMDYDGKFKKVVATGRVLNGKKDGEWTGTEEGIKSTFKETYKNGQLVTGQSVNAGGETFTYSGKRSSGPEFKGGAAAFGRYLGENINYPTDARRDNIEGRVLLTFVVEKDGSITDVKVTRHVSPSLDDEAVRVISNSPKWTPASLIGQPVKVSYSVPINFALK